MANSDTHMAAYIHFKGKAVTLSGTTLGAAPPFVIIPCMYMFLSMCSLNAFKAWNVSIIASNALIPFSDATAA